MFKFEQFKSPELLKVKAFKKKIHGMNLSFCISSYIESQ